MLFIWILELTLVLQSATIMSTSKIDPALFEILKDEPTTKVIVSMSDDLKDLHADLEHREYADRNDRLNTVNRELTAFAEESQKPVIQVLQQESKRIPVTWNSMWISNQVIATGVDLDCIRAIASIANVAKIEGEKFMQLHKSLVKPVGPPRPVELPDADSTK